MVRRGMSLEQKRQILLNMFLSSNTFFNLKEMEKKGAKLGLPVMSIKDVAQTLVDDNLLCLDRIGSSNYYWAFASQVGCRKRQRENDLINEREEKIKRKKMLEDEQEKLEDAREESDERTEALAEVEELKAKLVELDRKLVQYADSNPEVVAKIRADAALAREAANRWTDNVFQVRTYCRKTYNMEPKQFDQYFGIDATFDYLE
ncbi:Mnd1 family protein [Thecamonas trahens ATCC 50062]|uniref:Mnd1 family protein n=1 Tax=Thecamonas trahens ATCC 50062 TaxID=461836 RepID=A0A0L0DCS0_THETB|nr:Mnd1 family protein [Thecamonas trahens ATCC 50062]KNC50035.1 Mnd1 family protein [Thecamonas trahens ATCC 50062]|eukprot:XP_013757202.1 Mnd1 family protein [Thecamonas trahens ATCC 50062]